MNFFDLLDKAFTWWGGWLMKLTYFFGINQKSFVFFIIGLSTVLWTLIYQNGIFYQIILVIAVLCFAATSWVAAEMIEELERDDDSGVRVLPSGPFWSKGNRVFSLTSGIVGPSLYLISNGFPLQIGWLALLFPFGSVHLYLLLNYDIRSKRRFKDMVKSGMSKLKEILARRPAPVPHPC